ncbi:MAG: hypothetical protein M0Q44_01935 [Methylobacter sp.]|jgi:hypothetical protein|nr:hypothetical protein [Methylobacter sp.]
MADINNLPEPSITIAERMLKHLGEDVLERCRHDYRITIKIQKNDFNHEEDKFLEFTFRNKSHDETEPLLTRKDFWDYLSSKGFKPLEAVIKHFGSGQQPTLIIIDMVKMRLDSPKSYFSDDCESIPDMAEVSSNPMARFLDSDYSIDNLIEFMGQKRIKYDFFEFAEEVKSWMPELKPQAANEPANIKDIQDKPQRTRKTNLSHAINEAVKSFKKKPSFDELWQFFQDDKDSTGIIVDYTDTHLTWKDTKGKLHDTQKETIANHLSRIKS